MKCQYPHCGREASETWALVPLCKGHYEDIRIETYAYYRGRRNRNVVISNQSDRVSYLEISHLIKWSRGRTVMRNETTSD